MNQIRIPRKKNYLCKVVYKLMPKVVRIQPPGDCHRQIVEQKQNCSAIKLTVYVGHNVCCSIKTLHGHERPPQNVRSSRFSMFFIISKLLESYSGIFCLFVFLNIACDFTDRTLNV